jgi:hypothetical protein
MRRDPNQLANSVGYSALLLTCAVGALAWATPSAAPPSA